MNSITIAAAIIGILLGGVIAFAVRDVFDLLREKNRRISNLEKEKQELQEALDNKRHTENTTAGLEGIALNAVSNMFRIQKLVRENNLELDLIEAELKKVAEIAGMVRAGPRSYSPDTPSGERRTNTSKWQD